MNSGAPEGIILLFLNLPVLNCFGFCYPILSLSYFFLKICSLYLNLTSFFWYWFENVLPELIFLCFPNLPFNKIVKKKKKKIDFIIVLKNCCFMWSISAVTENYVKIHYMYMKIHDIEIVFQDKHNYINKKYMFDFFI